MGRPAPGRGRRGSVGLELALVLAAVLLTGWLGFELVEHFARQRRGDRLAADLVQFAELFRAHPPAAAAAKAGSEPPLPPALVAALAETNWRRGSPFGGNYEWVPAAGGPGRIVVTAFAPAFPLQMTRADLQRVDRAIDDGDPATGRLRAGFNGWPEYALAASP